MGTFMHATEGEMVCESINTKIPYFNAPIFLENKVHIAATPRKIYLTICRQR
jgi:H/ACA ribonucleoprotein complex subunit 1